MSGSQTCPELLTNGRSGLRMRGMLNAVPVLFVCLMAVCQHVLSRESRQSLSLATSLISLCQEGAL